ncbi:hypothetical protein THAOC_07636, partial [Thalassiosira oceanica]
AMGAVVGPPGEAMEELDSPYHRCCAVVPAEPTGCLVATQYRRENRTSPRGKVGLGPESAARPHAGPFLRFPLGQRLHAEIGRSNRWYMTKASGTQCTRPGFDRVSYHSILCDGTAGGTDRPARSQTVTSAQPALLSTWFLPVLRCLLDMQHTDTMQVQRTDDTMQRMDTQQMDDTQPMDKQWMDTQWMDAQRMDTQC